MPGSSMSVMSRSHSSVSDAAQGVGRVELVCDLKAAELAQHPGHEPAEGAIVVDEQYAPAPLTRLPEFHEAPRPALRPAATPGPKINI